VRPLTAEPAEARPRPAFDSATAASAAAIPARINALALR
jgi:hypothetical protein